MRPTNDYKIESVADTGSWNFAVIALAVTCNGRTVARFPAYDWEGARHALAECIIRERRELRAASKG